MIQEKTHIRRLDIVLENFKTKRCIKISPRLVGNLVKRNSSMNITYNALFSRNINDRVLGEEWPNNL
jgi:hypothetical protein